MRTTARETLFKIVFASQFSGDGEENLLRALSKAEKLTDSDEEYIKSVLDIISAHGEEFSDLLDKHSRLFPESRLFPADRSILYISLAEMLYGGIPAPVSINEAANIASKYSSEKSPSFISGLLSEIMKERQDV